MLGGCVVGKNNRSSLKLTIAALKEIPLHLSLFQLRWRNRRIVWKLNPTQQIAYAIFAAEQVIEIFEKRCPENSKPKKAIEAAREYLKNPSKNKTEILSNTAHAAYIIGGIGYAESIVQASRAAHYAALSAFWHTKDDLMGTAYSTIRAVKSAALAIYFATNSNEEAALDWMGHAAYRAAAIRKMYDDEYDISARALKNEIKVLSIIIEYGLSLIKSK